MIVGLDIDGTVVEHDYPRLGRVVPGAFEALREAQEIGARFVVFTMRDGAELAAACKLCVDQGLVLYGTNTNPTQHEWTMSPKAHCHVYVDDSSLCMPLVYPSGQRRPYVDWVQAGPALLRAVDVWMAAHPTRRGAILSSGRYKGGA